jgi:hypothetical protein
MTTKNYDELLELAKKYVEEAEKDAEANPTSEDIQIVVVEPGDLPYKKTIKNDYLEFQKIVGGYYENVTIGRSKTGGSFAIHLNEEGKLIGLPFNRKIIGFDILVGTFFITAFNKQGDNISLTDKEADAFIRRFTPLEVYLH